MGEIELFEFDYNADDAREAAENYNKKCLKDSLKKILDSIALEANVGKTALSKKVPMDHSEFCLEQLQLRGFTVNMTSFDSQNMYFKISWKERIVNNA